VTANTLITNTYVWNLLSSCFYETSIFKIVSDIVSIVFLANSIQIKSNEQFFLYFLFSLLASTIVTSTYCFVRFFSTGQEENLISPIYGFNGVIMCVLMFARQQRRSEQVYSSVPGLTYHNSPTLFILFQVVCLLLGFRSLVMDFHFTLISLFFCWSYLRFYYRYNEFEPAGDKSEDFSFVAMFPEPLHIVLIPFTTAFYNLFAIVGLFPALEPVEKKLPHHLRYNEPPSIAQQSSSGERLAELVPKVDLVAERRRLKAMKLVESKIAELSQESEGWDDNITPPSMMDIEGGAVSMKIPELSKIKV